MSAYDTIRPRLSWTAISCLALLAMVLFLSGLPLLVRAYRGFHFWAGILWTFLPLASLLGTVSGAIAVAKSRRDPGPGRGGVTALSLVLNATILFSCVAALVGSRLF